MAKKSTISTTGRQGGRGDRRGPGKRPEKGTQIIIEIELRPFSVFQESRDIRVKPNLGAR
jgi:hypothetical protein